MLVRLAVALTCLFLGTSSAAADSFKIESLDHDTWVDVGPTMPHYVLADVSVYVDRDAKTIFYLEGTNPRFPMGSIVELSRDAAYLHSAVGDVVFYRRVSHVQPGAIGWEMVGWWPVVETRLTWTPTGFAAFVDHGVESGPLSVIEEGLPWFGLGPDDIDWPLQWP